MPRAQVRQVINAYLRGLRIVEHADKRTEHCSGGTRRKLSYALAMLGAPSVVLLDEPSTGMDPKSKRFLWDTILAGFQAGRRRGAVLTTHSMEEADALCSRVAIMVRGELRCLGSTQHLKNLYGAGYTLEVKLATAYGAAGHAAGRTMVTATADVPATDGSAGDGDGNRAKSKRRSQQRSRKNGSCKRSNKPSIAESSRADDDVDGIAMATTKLQQSGNGEDNEGTLPLAAAASAAAQAPKKNIAKSTCSLNSTATTTEENVNEVEDCVRDVAVPDDEADDETTTTTTSDGSYSSTSHNINDSHSDAAAPETARFRAFVERQFKDARLEESFADRLVYSVPQQSVSSLAECFAQLERGEYFSDRKQTQYWGLQIHFEGFTNYLISPNIHGSYFLSKNQKPFPVA